MEEAEACYRLLPSMLLKKSNVACQWLSLGSKEDRSSRWRKATEDDCNESHCPKYKSPNQNSLLSDVLDYILGQGA